MNRMMFYGGFGLSAALLIAAVLFFIIFKIPSVHRYFRKNSKRGLVEATAVEGTKGAKKGPRRISRAEYENLTEVISLEDSDTATVLFQAEDTGYLLGEQPPEAESGIVSHGTTLLDQTEILP